MLNFGITTSENKIYLIAAFCSAVLFSCLSSLLIANNLSLKWAVVTIFISMGFLFFLLVKDKMKFLLGFLIISISFSARLRFLSGGVHQGGAELAISPFDFPLIGIFILWFMESALGKGKKIKWQRVDIAIFFFWLSCALSMINSSYYNFSIYELLRMIKFYIFFLFIRSYVTSWKEVRFIIFFLCIAILIQSFFGFLQEVFGSSLGLNIFETTKEVGLEVEGVSRVEGTMGHPNGLGQFLNMSLFLFFASLSTEENPKYRFFYFFVIIISLLLLILTLSRSSWTAFLLSFIIYKFIRKSGKKIKIHRKKFISIGVTIGLLIFVFTFRNVMLERFMRSSESTLHRTLLLIVAYNMVSAHPFVGVGINNFTEVMKNYDTTGVSDVFPAPVHNKYALVLSETGIVGLFFFLVLIFHILIYLYRRSNSLDPLVAIFSAGIFSGIISILLSSMITVGLIGDSKLLMFWLLSGLGFAIKNFSTRQYIQRSKSLIEAKTYKVEKVFR